MLVVSSHRRFNIPFQHFIPLFLLLLFFSSFRNGLGSIAFFSSNTSRVDGGSRSCDQRSRQFTSPRGNTLDLISSLSASCVYNTKDWTSRSAGFSGSPWAAPNSNIPAILHYGTHRLLSTSMHAYPFCASLNYSDCSAIFGWIVKECVLSSDGQMATVMPADPL